MLKKKNNSIATNRRASYDYKIGDKFEAGIVLKGSEVKSLRSSRAKGEIFLKNSSIPQYLSSGMLNHEVSRSRKLLFKKKEIKRMLGNINKKGTSLVPLKIYFSSKGFAKLLIAIGEGKKKYDKRQVKKEKEWKRQKKLI